MSNIQFVVTAAIMFTSLLFAFWAVAKFAASDTFVTFSPQGVSGTFCATIGMVSMVPGVLALVVFYKTQNWQVPDWFVAIWVLMTLAAIMTAMFVGAKKHPPPLE